MTKNRIFSAIANVSLMVAGMVPIALCFGFMAEDPQRYVHNLFAVGIYCFLVGIVSFVVSLSE